MNKELLVQPYFQSDGPGVGGSLEQQEREHYNDLGTILYANGTKQVKIVSDSMETLHIEEVLVAPAEQGSTEIKGINKLDKYTALQFGQISFNSVSIDATADLQSSGPDVTFHIPHTDLTSQKDGVLDFEEKDFLRVLTGEKGGILVFKQPGKPKEYALLIEHADDPQKATIEFFHTKGSTDEVHDGKKRIRPEVHSDKAVKDFFNEISINLLLDPNAPPEQVAVVAAIEREVKEGDLTGNEDQLAIFKAMAIAHARLGSKTFLDKYLPRRHMRKLRERLQELEYNDTRSLSEPVGEIFIHPTGEVVTQEQKLESIKEGRARNIKLETQHGRKLYDQYHDELQDKFGSSTDNYAVTLMTSYFIDIRESIKSAKTPEDYSDLIVLIDELSNTAFADRYIQCDANADISYLSPSYYFESADAGSKRNLRDILRKFKSISETKKLK